MGGTGLIGKDGRSPSTISFELRDRPLDEVLAEFRQTFDNLLTVVKNMPQEDLNAPDRFPGTSSERLPWQSIAIHSYEHDREHIDLIRLWRDRLTKAG